VAMLMVEPVEAQVEWGFPLRSGSRIPRLAPSNVYSCSDGYVALNAAPPRLWKRLAQLIGSPELLDPALIPLVARLDRQDWIDAEVARWVATQTVDELMAATSKQGVPCARVAESIDELVDDPSLIARGMLHPLEHPVRGVMPGIFAPSVPIHTPGETAPPLARAPQLGEHTHAILSRELGLSEAEIRDLESKKLI